VTEAVLRREAEFGISMAGAHHPELVSLPFLQDRYVLICRSDHPLADKKRLFWKQLESYPLICPSHVSRDRAQLDLALGAENLAFQPHFEVERSSTAVGMAAEGVAAAIVPGLAVQRGAYPNLRVVAMTSPVVSWTLVLLTRKKAHLSPAAQALYEIFRKKTGIES
jgi:DNA-binding transcriptional LysR family regulator